jgi:hypothetical protein
VQDSFVGTVHKNTIHIYKATTMNYKINKKLNNKISDNTTLLEYNVLSKNVTRNVSQSEKTLSEVI